MRLEEKVARRLFRQKKTIALAESCTGGLLGHRLTNISGSSRYLKLGLVVYSYEAKEKLLKIPRQTLRQYGAVSDPVTTQLAQNVRKILKTDFGVGITGIAGPTGATKTKPLGLVYIAVATKRKIICVKYLFKGSRISIKTQAADKALQLLLEFLSVG
ncbi:MAG: hypothetical protein A3D10_00465 [Omnitrophica WOR_2 bacterium RIFCSPHIGHO2_02_FULL_48_11]|nr:MAG: hypothetical protein A3D10_00465 [Omnitrophica WOR_2 bacterium RIFCSPHIGHO2_02_FULL_48_11]